MKELIGEEAAIADEIMEQRMIDTLKRRGYIVEYKTYVASIAASGNIRIAIVGTSIGTVQIDVWLFEDGLRASCKRDFK